MSKGRDCGWILLGRIGILAQDAFPHQKRGHDMFQPPSLTIGGGTYQDLKPLSQKQ